MTKYIRGDMSAYAVPVKFTCPTAKRALLLAGTSMVIAVVALIRASRASVALQQDKTKTAQDVINELNRRLGMTAEPRPLQFTAKRPSEHVIPPNFAEVLLQNLKTRLDHTKKPAGNSIAPPTPDRE